PRELGRSGFEPKHRRVDSRGALSQALDEQTWDVVLCDYAMPGFSAENALTMVQERGLDVPFLIVSGTVGEDVAVTIMKAGAHDYLMKFNLTRLGAAVRRELHEAFLRAERNRAERALRQSEARFRTLVEHSPDFVLVVRGGKIQYVNPAASAALGYGSDEL